MKHQTTCGFEDGFASGTSIWGGELRRVGLILHLLQNALLLFSQYASFIEIFDLKTTPSEFEIGAAMRKESNAPNFLRSFFSYVVFSATQALPSSPGLRMWALSRHAKYASRPSQQCCRPSLETAVGSGVLLPNQPI
jgi:hypothetical protein